jgi:hypothetical protein
MRKYILDAANRPVPCDDLNVWGQWFATADRTVARTEVAGAQVSTVFLGFDHGFGATAMPVLWETMIFGGPHDDWQERYTSHEDALAGHARAVEMAGGALPETPPPQETGTLRRALRLE